MEPTARALLDRVVTAGRDKSLTYLAGLTPPSAELYPMARGFRAMIGDEYGELFLDFSCGEHLLFGHRNPEIFNTLCAQVNENTWRPYGCYQDRRLADYAEMLSTRFPEKDGAPLKVFFVTSPYEARVVAAQLALGPPSAGSYFVSLLDHLGELRGGGEIQDEVHRARAQQLKIVADEMVTGFGRTGTFCLYEQYFLNPDIIMLDGGTAGIPLCAVLASHTLFDNPSFATLTTHIQANPTPLACAAGVRTMEQLTSEVIQYASAMGGILAAELATVCAQFPDIIAGICGVGLIRTLHLTQPHRAAQFRICCRQAGLLITPGLRLVPPLIVSSEQIKTACDAVAAACIDMAD